ncbi:MAG: quinolinate synthase NadA [Candidatus Omnitrophica bacterium]|nr:quinolinate synthase NadA [Candidatus Omnitrophota bacterium]MCF7877289.1 quinolinate synthase NadA [Candidatus Omnitrophota bacterium]MCF7878579.1 quinolinate synthase NadA [Candidatus Omnitrophota bacterium]MCF7892653.1 quinolinate synthase NadA [Candidatus Omnitrophota bacterium]
MKLADKIKKLKKEKNAVILVHNYQNPEVQEIADFTGDSLGLSKKAAATDADIIIFCGVFFMAETAKILSPQKKVILPDEQAGCPMADMITAKQLIELKRKHPKAKVLTYVNSPAEVKAESDFCCTSANSISVVEKAFSEDDQIIFVPDKFLGQYTAGQTKRDFIFWQGYCPAHAKISPEDLRKQKEIHPDAKIIVHPECRPETIALADRALSTSGMIKFAKETTAKKIIVGTEPGMIYPLRKYAPDKCFYPASSQANCPDMKKINLEKVLNGLENLSYEIKIKDEIIHQAKRSIQRMLDLS